MGPYRVVILPPLKGGVMVWVGWRALFARSVADANILHVQTGEPFVPPGTFLFHFNIFLTSFGVSSDARSFVSSISLIPQTLIFELLVGVEIRSNKARQEYVWCQERCRKLCLTHIFDFRNAKPLTPHRCGDLGRRRQTR